MERLSEELKELTDRREELLIQIRGIEKVQGPGGSLYGAELQPAGDPGL